MQKITRDLIDLLGHKIMRRLMENRLMLLPIIYVVAVVAFGLIAMLILPGGHAENHHRGHTKDVSLQINKSTNAPSAG
jgi:hypothetical protein